MKGCKNCKYAKWIRTEKGNIKTSRPGSCEYVVELPLLPDSIEKNYSFNQKYLFSKIAIWPGDGIDCKVYKND